MVPPEALHKPYKGHKPYIIEEGTGNEYNPDELQTVEKFHELLKVLDGGAEHIRHANETEYYKTYVYKGNGVLNRVKNLPKLYRDIKDNGIQQPIHVTRTGERLDGAYRTKIAMHLGIKKVPAILHRFTWQDIDDDFIERKLHARQMSSGSPDYYEFSYNEKWNNGKAGRVHRENAERWKIISELAEGSIVDVGCNEGYISLQLARKGHKVWGVDHDQIHLANLNRLIYEYIDKKDLDATYEWGDIQTVEYPESDTALLLNIIYHIPRDEQVKLLGKLKGRKLIFQCNLRKKHVRDQYYGAHPDDLKDIIEKVGMKVEKEIEYGDKPLIVCR
jgi:hypothetical protein